MEVCKELLKEYIGSVVPSLSLGLVFFLQFALGAVTGVWLRGRPVEGER